MSDNDHPTVAINKNLHRLPLILDILDEIESGTSHPGDEHLRHGSHQAVRCMVERLHGIKPQKAAGEEHPPENEIAIAHTWLLGERPRKLLPPMIYTELSLIIGKLTTGKPEMSGQTE